MLGPIELKMPRISTGSGEDIRLFYGTKIRYLEAPASSKTRKVIRSPAAKVPCMVKSQEPSAQVGPKKTS